MMSNLKTYQYKAWHDFSDVKKASEIKPEEWETFECGRSNLDDVAELIAEANIHKMELENYDEIYILVRDEQNHERSGLFWLEYQVSFCIDEITDE